METKIKARMTSGPWEVVNGLIYGPDSRLIVMMPSTNDERAVQLRSERLADLDAIAALPDIIQQLQTANVNLGLIHSDYQITQGGHGSLYSCECPLATNWRNNRAALRKAGVID